MDDAAKPVGKSISPLPGRRFGDDEISRILQGAADLQARSHSLTHDHGRGLSLEELRQVAEEAGIDPRFIDLAASDLNAPVERRVSALAGGTYSWHFRTAVEGVLSDHDYDLILREIRAVMGRKGDLGEVFGRMEWSHDEGGGPTIIGISNQGGKTEIDVSATKWTEVGFFHGFGIPFGGIFGGALVSKFLAISGPAALPVIAAMGVVSYVGARLGWRLRSRWWERRLRLVVDRISGIVHDVAARTPDESSPG